MGDRTGCVLHGTMLAWHGQGLGSIPAERKHKFMLHVTDSQFICPGVVLQVHMNSFEPMSTLGFMDCDGLNLVVYYLSSKVGPTLIVLIFWHQGMVNECFIHNDKYIYVYFLLKHTHMYVY